MQALQIEDREEVLPKPNPPIHGANQVHVNEYKIRYEAWKVQSTAINEVTREQSSASWMDRSQKNR
jgi:hypothetical protein